MLGGEVVESQQLGLVVGDLLDGLGELRAVELGERSDRLDREVAVIGVVDVLKRLAGAGLSRLRQSVERIGGFVRQHL